MADGSGSPQKLQPALLGGAFMGVLSALPFVSYANACCCLWVIVGGLLAAWVMQQNHPYAITTADGALVGLLAGACGAIIGSVIGLVLAPVQLQLDLFLLGRMSEMVGEVPPVVEQMIEQRRAAPGMNAVAAIFGLILALIVYPIFAMLGGLLGAAFFKKGTPPPVVTAADPLSEHPPLP